MITKIISGGQTGADSAGLYAAKELGFETGGWAPYNWQTENGFEMNRLRSFGLKPAPFDIKIYPLRTVMNIKSSDGTLWMGTLYSPGARITISKARGLGKPLITNPTRYSFIEWIDKNNISVLNVAGNRESKNPGIFMKTKLFLLGSL